MIRKKIIIFFIWIVRRSGIVQIIRDIDNQDKIAACNRMVTNSGANFYPEAIVSNMQKDPSKIVIGKGTLIRGQLNLFKYGGVITFGDNCYVGEGSKVWSGDSISIGNNVLISHNVNIVDTNSHELNSIERSDRYIDMLKNGHWVDKGAIITSPIIIKDFAWISFNCTILKGVTIGKGAIVGAGCIVTKDVPDYAIVAGNPPVVVNYTK